MNSLYNEHHILGRLFIKFMDIFPQANKPTHKLLILFLIGQLCTEHFTSVRNLHKLCFDSWYAKKKLIDWALSHSNVNIICNARHDTVMWDLPEPTSEKRGRPRKYGDKLSLDSINDFHGEIKF